MAEYALADRILSEMKPMSDWMVLGWHSYGKDLEREYVARLALQPSCGRSAYASERQLRTLDNASPGFVYENNHSIVPGRQYVPGKKVYITCVQTDGIGLGAYFETRQGRSRIPGKC
ncbi:MAG: hypothetical protein MZV64_49275 [Ignavibacteriales bacterium]|nr:hypothetical protein [Ignavibacteriales bacterium]